ncbi:MAG: hypothetical protein AAGK78_16665, partial [Planctomycetota bacterium]
EASDTWMLREPVVTALGQLVPVSLLAAEIASPTMAADKAHVLVAALAQSPDAEAGDALLRLAKDEPQPVRVAVARASNAVLWRLLQLLDAPRFADRELAARLLSASEASWVYASAATLLERPSHRQLGLRVLMQSDSSVAKRILDSVRERPELERHFEVLEAALAAESESSESPADPEGDSDDAADEPAHTNPDEDAAGQNVQPAHLVPVETGDGRVIV